MRFLWLLLLVPTAGFADQIRVYGFDMHYTEVGRGPVIVLLHGLWGGTNEWQPILEPLAAKSSCDCPRRDRFSRL